MFNPNPNPPPAEYAPATPMRLTGTLTDLPWFATQSVEQKKLDAFTYRGTWR